MLERVVGIVAFGDLDGEDTCNLTDLNFLRIFRLSQLTAEYLLHVQDHLAQENSQLKVFCTSYIAFRAHMPAHKAAQHCIASRVIRSMHQLCSAAGVLQPSMLACDCVRSRHVCIQASFWKSQTKVGG